LCEVPLLIVGVVYTVVFDTCVAIYRVLRLHLEAFCGMSLSLHGLRGKKYLSQKSPQLSLPEK
jgi:hypothetical protein